MNAETKTNAVETVLASSHAMLTVNDLRRITGLDEQAVRAQLKALAQQGQIEHIPGRGRYDGKYGLLRTTPQKPAGGDSEGGETDVRAIPAPEYDPNSVAFGSGAHPSSDAALASRIERLCKDLHYDTSGMRFGTFMVADLITLVLNEQDDLRHQVFTAHAELDAIAAAMPGVSYMDPPDGGDVPLAVQVDRMRDDLKNTRALAEKLECLLGSERTTTAALREQIEHMTRGGDQTPAGYLVRAPKRAHRIVTKPEKAQAHALAAARNGSGRGEVFALVPIGRAVRGAEWRPAK